MLCGSQPWKRGGARQSAALFGFHSRWPAVAGKMAAFCRTPLRVSWEASACRAESPPNQSGFLCPRNAVFWSLFRIFEKKQHNLLAINTLQLKSSISN
jgi:hypothetical protein